MNSTNRKATVDSAKTDYYCHIFKTPEDWSITKRHLIRVSISSLFIY